MASPLHSLLILALLLPLAALPAQAQGVDPNAPGVVILPGDRVIVRRGTDAPGSAPAIQPLSPPGESRDPQVRRRRQRSGGEGDAAGVGGQPAKPARPRSTRWALSLPADASPKVETRSGDLRLEFTCDTPESAPLMRLHLPADRVRGLPAGFQAVLFTDTPDRAFAPWLQRLGSGKSLWLQALRLHSGLLEAIGTAKALEISRAGTRLAAFGTQGSKEALANLQEACRSWEPPPQPEVAAVDPTLPPDAAAGPEGLEAPLAEPLDPQPVAVTLDPATLLRLEGELPPAPEGAAEGGLPPAPVLAPAPTP